MTAELVDEMAGIGLLPVSVGKLALALAKAQGVMNGAVKDAANPFFKSKYADLASVWDACRKPLAENELAVAQSVSAHGATVTVTTYLIHSSGESITSSLSLTAKGDDPQSIGSAITYGRRYGLSAMVGIAPEDDDGNAASQPQRAQPAPPAHVPTALAEPVGKPPTSPAGYHFVSSYQYVRGWHEFYLLAWDQAGGRLKCSTRKDFGELAKQAQDGGIPVKATVAHRDSPGEAYVNSLELYVADKDIAF